MKVVEVGIRTNLSISVERKSTNKDLERDLQDSKRTPIIDLRDFSGE